VTGITYDTSGGKGGTAHLMVYVNVVNDLGDSVDGATVTIDLDGPDTVRTLTATTAGGTATYKVPNAPAGNYTSVVVSITLPGYTWDGLTPANGFDK